MSLDLFRREWVMRAACASAEPHLFDQPDRRAEAADRETEALEFCAVCPVVGQCLAEAVDLEHPGIWGNTTREQRAPLIALKVSAERKATRTGPCHCGGTKTRAAAQCRECSVARRVPPTEAVSAAAKTHACACGRRKTAAAETCYVCAYEKLGLKRKRKFCAGCGVEVEPRVHKCSACRSAERTAAKLAAAKRCACGQIIDQRSRRCAPCQRDEQRRAKP